MSKLEKSDRRKYPRVQTDAVILVRREDGETWISQGVDLGGGGARLRCVGLNLQVGDVVEVTIPLEDACVSVVGKTVRVNNLNQFTQEIGLEFVSVDPETQQRFCELGLAKDADLERDRGPEHTPTDDRRSAPRFKLRAPVEYRAGALQGDGTIWNISTSGVRIENASAPLKIGFRVGLRSSFFPGAFEVELTGQVVRQTPNGFAAQFVELEAPQAEMLRSVLPQIATGSE